MPITDAVMGQSKRAAGEASHQGMWTCMLFKCDAIPSKSLVFVYSEGPDHPPGSLGSGSFLVLQTAEKHLGFREEKGT